MKSMAFVRGGAGVIGEAIALLLATDGFRVVIVDRNESLLGTALHESANASLAVDAKCVDLADQAAVEALANDLPSVAALVNNAGLFDEKAFLELDADDFRRMYEINLVAAAVLTQAIAPGMRPGAKIVNIASRAYLGARNHDHYVAFKAALVGYTRDRKSTRLNSSH